MILPHFPYNRSPRPACVLSGIPDAAALSPASSHNRVWPNVTSHFHASNFAVGALARSRPGRVVFTARSCSVHGWIGFLQAKMQLRLLLCATLLATADARLALSVDSHTTLVVTPERVYESAASLAIIDARARRGPRPRSSRMW